MGKPSRDKGARFEREVVRAVQAAGLVCYRVAGSGALASRVQSKTAAATLRDDVVIELEDGREIRVECKVRAASALPAYIKPWTRWRGEGVTIAPEEHATHMMISGRTTGCFDGHTRPLPGYLRDWLSSTGVVCMRQDRGPRLWVFRDDWRKMQGWPDAD